MKTGFWLSIRRLMTARAALAGLVVSLSAGGVAFAQAEPGKNFKDCPDCPEMVVIPPGVFTIGSTPEEQKREGVPPAFAEREGPQVKVTIAKPFAMAKTEVTRGQYAKFVAATNRPVVGDCLGYDKATDSWGGKDNHSWKDPGFEQTDDHPVVCISLTDARDYAAWLAKTTGKPYRLASESEWEYAARAGTTTVRYWGDAVQPVCEKASVMNSATFAALGSPESWLDKLICAGEHAWTVPVGSFEANPFGVQDLFGSVWEYVADCARPTHEGLPTDGTAQTKGDCTRGVTKGGAFHSVSWLIRPATRGAGLSGTARPIASGIRVVRGL